MVTAAIKRVLAYRWRAAALRVWVIGAAACLSACTTQVAGVLPLFDSLTVVSWVSTAVSGKSLSEYALDALTGKDCRFLDGVLRADREICEQPGAPSTGEDFRGLAGLWDRDKLEPGQPAAALAVIEAPGETLDAVVISDAGKDELIAATAPLP